MYHICQYCSKPFNARTSREKYCSVKCRQMRARQKEIIRRKENGTPSKAVHEERSCRYCGKKFISSRIDQIYCSPSCRALSSRKNRETERQSYEG